MTTSNSRSAKAARPCLLCRLLSRGREPDPEPARHTAAALYEAAVLAAAIVYGAGDVNPDPGVPPQDVTAAAVGLLAGSLRVIHPAGRGAAFLALLAKAAAAVAAKRSNQ